MNDRAKYRLLEMIPGLLVWGTLILAVLLSFLKPLWAIYFIVAFDLYWLLRIIYMLIYMLTSWRRYRRNIKIGWYEKLQTDFFGRWENIYHLVFLPTYKEPYEIVKLPFESIINSSYPNEKFIVVLAGEERDEAHFLEVAEKLKREYGDKFFRMIINIHPKDLEGELPGKGSNIHHAGWQAKKLIDELQIPYENIIVSSFDIDTCVHEQYFACLTHHYLKNPNPTRASYQPLAIYNNNIWESNPVVRVVASSTTFWLLTDLSRAERLFTFSSHSMSFKALVEVGFWDKTIVTEDSRIFLQCFVKYDGDYKVTPLYMPVYMSTVEIGKFSKSLANQYKQMRRWAWGVEHFPWMVWHFWGKYGNNKIRLTKKFRYIWNQTEGVYSWATAPLLILLVGYLPLWLASEQERQTAIFQNAPEALAILMRLAMIGLIVAAALYGIMLPPKPKEFHWYNYLIMALQWLMVPATLIIFGSLPATDAQTRLMLGGKYRLGFWVTEKTLKHPA